MFKINSVSELETLSQKVKWQYFEKLVAFIFEQNGFDAKQNVVIVKGKDKKQFDVIAVRYNKTYLVECKKWRTGRSLKKAARDHKGRCEFYKNAYGKANPLIVTLKDVNTEATIPIIPIMKLNAYINEEL